MDENKKFDVVGTNIAEKATVIWNVADMLRGPFKPHEYGLVILPMTVVKRFHDCLLPTHKAVLEQYEKVKNFAVIDGFLTKASGYQFYNISKYTFESLLADPENIEANFRDYLNGFSANVQDVLAKFDFDNIIRRMVESNTLYLVIKEFNSQKGYLGPDKISAVDCGYIFEDLVKRFSESFGEEAGAHFTSRDIIYLMTDLLLSDADLSKGGNDKTELRYIDYIFKIERFQKELRKYANGILEIRLRISVHDTLRRLIPIPDFKEQCRIADFLDKKSKKIDIMIIKQQEYSDLLVKYKYSLYTEEAKKLKGKKVLLGRIIKNIEQGWSPAPAERNEDGDWDVLTLAAVKYGEFLGDEVKRFSGSVEKCGNLILKKDDFLLTRSNTRDLVGQVCIVDKNMEKTIFSDLIYRLTFNKKYVEPEYLMFYFQTAMMRQQISKHRGIPFKVCYFKPESGLQYLFQNCKRHTGKSRASRKQSNKNYKEI